MAIWGVIGKDAETRYIELESAWNKLIGLSGVKSNEKIDNKISENISIGWTTPHTHHFSEENAWIYGPYILGNKSSLYNLAAQIEDPDVLHSDSQLDGQFLHVLLDSSKKQLELRTDNSGIRAPFVILKDGHFYFSSNPVQLALCLDLKIDGDKALFFMNTGMTAVSGNLFEDITRMGTSSRLTCNFTNHEAIAYEEKTYLTEKHLKKDLRPGSTIKILEMWFAQVFKYLFENVKNPICDLTIGVDSRLLAAFSDKYSPTKVTYITGLDEVEESREIASHLNNVKEHIDQNMLELNTDKKSLINYLNAFLLANGAQDLRFASKAAWRSVELFSGYDFRIAGPVGEILREFPFIHEIHNIMFGRKPTIDNHIKYRINNYQLPEKLWKESRSAFEILKKDVEYHLTRLPAVQGTDLNDAVYSTYYSRSRNTPISALSDRLYPYRYFTPFSFHRLMAISKKIPPNFRFMGNIPRILLHRNNLELCKIPSTLGYKLYPLKGLNRLKGISEILSQYLIRAWKKFRRIISIKNSGSQLNDFHPDSYQDELDRIIDSEVINIVKGKNSGLVINWANHDEFLRIVSRLENRESISGIEKVALDRYATLLRMEKLLND